MTALDEGIGAIEVQEIERRYMQAKLESFLFEMRQEALGSKVKLVQNVAQAEKVIKDAQAAILQSGEASLEKSRKMYEDLRGYFETSEPKLFQAVEAERLHGRESGGDFSSRKTMDAVVRFIEEGGATKLPEDERLKRARRDIEEAKQLVSSKVVNGSVRTRPGRPDSASGRCPLGRIAATGCREGTGRRSLRVVRSPSFTWGSLQVPGIPLP